MRTVFVLAEELARSEPARQLALTLPALPGDAFQVRIGVLGEPGPAEAFHDANIPVQRLPFRHTLDLGGLKQLRKTVTETKFEVLHAVGPRAIRLSRFLPGPRLVVSGFGAEEGFFGWLTTRQLRAATRVLCATASEEAEALRRGVAKERIARVPLAIAPAPASPEAMTFRRTHGLPADSRLIVTAGRLDRASGLRDAVWAFDVLKYESPNFWLVIEGEGPERERLESFGRTLGFDDFRIRFLGERRDRAALLPLAEAVWVPATRGGCTLALEAMAAGKPVFAWQGSEVSELVQPGETGFLVPRGDRVGLAGKTRGMLEDAALATRLGEQGRTVAARFQVANAAQELAALYRSVV